jgi:undecaprenyl-diphosphatase
VLTALFVVLSAWWVKGPLLLAVGLGCDVWRRRLPLAFLAAASAALAASAVVTPLKDAVGRARPPEADPDLGSLVAIPDNPSFPSGHAATAFAAAVAVALIYPRLRWPLLALAGVVSASRVYLGVHYLLDVAAGTLLGIAVGLAAVWAVNAVARWPRLRATSPARP